jgi:hypothetical protein
MNFFRQTKQACTIILGCLLVLVSVSCNSSEEPPAVVAGETPPPASAQPVEYGASLSEWEEATQADTEQTSNRDETNSEMAASQEAAVAETVPTATTTLDEVASPAESPVVTPTEEPVITEENTLYVFNDIAYKEIRWDALVPADFSPAAIMAKYEDQLAQIEDGSAEASALYTQMQEEFNSAPVNEALNETFVRLPGFIAPLEYKDDLITEFLLVPYFGACIHVPPPPANQTVLVKTDEGQGIKPEDAYYPIWVMGKLTTEGATTALAEAGYHIQDAVIEPYTSP